MSKLPHKKTTNLHQLPAVLTPYVPIFIDVLWVSVLRLIEFYPDADTNRYTKCVNASYKKGPNYANDNESIISVLRIYYHLQQKYYRLNARYYDTND